MNLKDGQRGKVTIWSRNFVCALIANFLLAFSHSSVNTLVSTYAVHLGASSVVMGLLTGMFFGVALAMRPVAGPITTKLDKRRLMIFVYTLGCVVNVGYAVFHNITAFVIFRFFNGVQYALVGSLCMTIAGDSLPMQKMASGLGVFGIGSAVATAIAPTVGIMMRDYGTSLRDLDFGYTLVFVVAALALGIAVIPSVLLTPDKKSKEEVESTGRWYSNIATKHAIGPTVVMTLLIIAYSLYSSYMVPFGEEMGVGGISTFFAVLAFVMVAARPLSGKLSDTLGLKKVLIPSIIIFAVSFVIVGFTGSMTVILLGAVVAAIGYGSANPGVQSMCMQCEVPLKRAVASNTLYIGMDLGYFIGPVIGGLIYAYSDYRTVIMAGAVPSVLALVCFVIFWPMYAARRKELEKTETVSAK